MYEPKGNGKDRSVDTVAFTEAEPPAHLCGIVHRYIDLNTQGDLPKDYRFHALPDACSYVVFDQLDHRIAGLSKLRAQSEEFNLGRKFHFVNIRFLPGVWQGDPNDIAFGLVDTPYQGKLPLLALNQKIQGQSFATQQTHLNSFVETLMAQGLVAPNVVVNRILAELDDMASVGDMAKAAGLSARQLQRTLKRTTGFSPHDFLKVLRLQQSLNGADTWSYADQSHFIHSFRRATGYTPGKYEKKFDV